MGCGSLAALMDITPNRPKTYILTVIFKLVK